MKYYHVLIETNDSIVPYYELDKEDLSEIKEEIVIPFLKGEQFLIDGHLFDKSNVKCLLIKESACTSEEYALREWMKSSPESRKYIYPEGIVGKNEYTTDITRSIFKECKGLLKQATSKPKPSMDKSKVFIVHGRDGEAKEAAARVVMDLGFEAIILHEQANSGKTIIEKIEANSNVGFGIVLYTPCDLGRFKEEEDQLKPRARQNVVFEHGYLMAKIGRKSVCALVKGDVETPSDISGVVYTEMDKAGAWKYAVADEMEACGYAVDRSKIKR